MSIFRSIKVYPFSPHYYDRGYPITKRMVSRNNYEHCKIAKIRIGLFNVGRCIFSLSDGIMKIECLEVREGMRFKGYGRRVFNVIYSHAKKQGIKGIYLTSTPSLRYFYYKCGMDLIDLDIYYIAFTNVCAQVNWVDTFSDKYFK